VPPVILLLEMLARAPEPDPTAHFLAAAQALTASYARGKIHQVWFTPGVRKLTLLTETLPPATHTNAYLVGGDTLYLVDPGATRADEQAKLFEALDEALAGGARLAAVLLTHAHRDHVGAVTAVVARYSVPVWAHAASAAALAGRIAVDRELADGDLIPLGASPDGRPGWQLEILYTPGTIRDTWHFASRGTVPSSQAISFRPCRRFSSRRPTGHLATYLESLRRLRALPGATLYPAHGPRSATATAFSMPTCSIAPSASARSSRRSTRSHAISTRSCRSPTTTSRPRPCPWRGGRSAPA
jgi:glyoxylase-like metal-dependent hydrolase (beta-lactamase superfamily II)